MKKIVGGVAALAVAGGIAMVSAAGLIIGTGRAEADPGENVSGYYGALTIDGIQVDSHSLTIGRYVCAALGSGNSEADIVNKLDGQTTVPRSVTAEVVTAAHIYLCPDAPAIHGFPR
jgi:hypothetical protein